MKPDQLEVIQVKHYSYISAVSYLIRILTEFLPKTATKQLYFNLLLT